MAEDNGDWIRHLDKKFEDHQKWMVEHMTGRLDKKADKDCLEKVEEKVEKIQSKTNKLAVKQASIAGSVAIVLGYFKFLITGHW